MKCPMCGNEMGEYYVPYRIPLNYGTLLGRDIIVCSDKICNGTGRVAEEEK